MFVLIETTIYLFGKDKKYIGTGSTSSDSEIDKTKYPTSQGYQTFTAPPSYDEATQIPVWENEVWVIHELSEYATAEPTLDELKETKRNEIAESRLSAESEGCAWGAYTVATDRESRAILTSAIAVAEEMGALFTSSIWKMASGEFVSVSLSDMKSMGLAIASYVQVLFDKEAALNAGIDSATTEDEIDLITWG